MKVNVFVSTFLWCCIPAGILQVIFELCQINATYEHHTVIMSLFSLGVVITGPGICMLLSRNSVPGYIMTTVGSLTCAAALMALFFLKGQSVGWFVNQTWMVMLVLVPGALCVGCVRKTIQLYKERGVYAIMVAWPLIGLALFLLIISAFFFLFGYVAVCLLSSHVVKDPTVFVDVFDKLGQMLS